MPVEESASMLFPLVKKLVHRGDTVIICHTAGEAFEQIDEIRRADLLLLGLFFAWG